MSPLAQLQKFAQSVYLVIKGRYFDDIDTEDGVTLIQQTVDWANMFIDEIEMETNPDGTPIEWKFKRVLGFELGTVAAGGASVAIPSSVDFVLTDENRYVQIVQGGAVVSNWAVVAPDQITNKSSRTTEDTCTQVGSTLTFSRAFRDYEDGGTVTADVSAPLPPITYSISTDGLTLTPTNIKLLSIVKPKTLLTLGVAKNASLPDIVQGGLSPSYAQKYGNLLQGAIARNNAGAVADEVVREDLSGVGGVY